ncbi:HAMP domain-containing protein [Eubacteriales bacterium OttesenSCG-928-M02]|nr:HAMP domain-containing protein [Eubacteriales bacterium OttesenSCG-928-M02]
MRKQLLSGIIRTLVIALVVAFLLVFTIIDNMYQDTAKKELIGLLGMFSAAYEVGEDPGAYVEENIGQMEAIDARDVRLTLIAEDGTVLADSMADTEGVENHLARPEVTKALTGELGFHTRRSTTTGENYMYVATHREGVVFRAALNLANVYMVRLWILLSCVAGLGVGLVAAYLISRKLAEKMADPVDDLILAATNMSGGNLYYRVEPGTGELGTLGEAFNQMADALVSVIYQQNEKQAELDAILESMEDGVVAVDGEGKLLLFNTHAPKLLYSDGLSLGQELNGSETALAVKGLLEDAMAGMGGTTTITVPVLPQMILDVTTTPLVLEEKVMGAVSVIHDMTHLMKLETMRTDFVSNVTHELKTPLTSIRGYVELLKSGDRDEATKQGFYDIIDIEAERLHALIEDLLQLSEIENGKDDPRLMVASMDNQVADLSDRFYNQTKNRNISFTMDVQEGMTLPMNPIRLRQLLTNLVDNAIKYNVEGGQVVLRAYTEGDVAILQVRDTGIGVPPDRVERIFERFYRVDKGRSRSMGGTGLGLSIVKHIVQMYGGEITVDSVEEKGTTFTIRIPLVRE